MSASVWACWQLSGSPTDRAGSAGPVPGQSMTTGPRAPAGARVRQEGTAHPVLAASSSTTALRAIPRMRPRCAAAGPPARERGMGLVPLPG